MTNKYIYEVGYKVDRKISLRRGRKILESPTISRGAYEFEFALKEKRGLREKQTRKEEKAKGKINHRTIAEKGEFKVEERRQ